MASTLLDQIKIMLKSMSYSIFTRIGRAEKNVQSLTDQVSNLKNQIPAKPKKIIFRQNSSDEYTCDLTFDALWAMEPEQIASNAILIDRYGIENAARSARKGGSFEYGIRNIQIDIDGRFESDMVTYFKPTRIIDWWAHGDVSAINVHSVSSLSNKTYQANGVPNVPIFQNGNWANCEVGNGLKMDGDVLSVEPNGEVELIEKITLSENVSDFKIDVTPDGKPYNFRRIIIVVYKPAVRTAGYMWLTINNMNPNEDANRIAPITTNVENERRGWCDASIVAGRLKSIHVDAQTKGATDTRVSSNEYAFMNLEAKSINAIRYKGGSFPEGTTITIYGEWM